MRFYRDDQGTFHRTQADAKASGRPWKEMDVPTDHKGLGEFLNMLNPPIELLPQIRALMNGAKIVTPDDLDNSLSGTKAEMIIVDDLDESGSYKSQGKTWEEIAEDYKEGQPTAVFMKSRDPKAIFTCTNCGKVNTNQARS